MKKLLEPGYYTPCDLPRWEIRLSYAVWIFHSLAAFAISYRVCVGPISPWIQHWFRDSDYVAGLRMDLSDSEWLFYRNTIGELIAAYTLHSITFSLTYRFLNSSTAKIVQIIVGLALHVWITSAACIVTTALFAFVTIGLTIIWRNQLPAWLLCIVFILGASEYLPFSKGTYIYYREFNVYLYNAIKILNVCIHLSRNESRPITLDFTVQMLLFMTYLPYTMTIIVLFEDFMQQISAREINSPSKCPYDSLRGHAFFGIRLVGWALIFEALLHVIPVNSIFSSPFTIITSLNGYEMSSIAYVVGQYFHVKYFIIFGVPSFFAKIDGMTPPGTPICISRVSRYSRMWRHFDVGLYSFIKNQVYVPIMALAGKSKIGRPLALISAFLIVLVWHGTKRHFVFWVSLSAFELVIERIGVLIWETTHFQRLRHRIGGLWTRRIVSFAMLMTVIPGIFGVFFFLGNEGVGETIFNSVLVKGITDIASLNICLTNGVPTSGMVFFHLIVLGYFYNHVCLQLEYSRRQHIKYD